MSAAPGFGAYLATVQERDVDLLLMEEFHVDGGFVEWFCERVGVPGARFDGAWHSVTDADGETDLLLRVVAGGDRVGVLVENKISAPAQERQDERYHIRAARAQNAGRFDRFVVCICAPRAYLDGLPGESAYQSEVAYEDISGWYERSRDARSAWRRAIMEEAVAQGRRGYRMVVNESVSRFHMEFWEHLQVSHPELTMRRPTPKGGKSNWLLFKGTGSPKEVGFHVKLDQRVVELGFSGRTVADLLQAIPELPEGIRPVQKGGTAALSVTTPALDRNRPLSGQKDALAAVMAAVTRLLPFMRALEDRPPELRQP